MVVGTSPGEEEVSALKPFVGPTSCVIREIIEGLGLTESTYFTNLIQTRVTDSSGANRKPTDAEIGTSCHHLIADIQRAKPDVILAVGSSPLSFLLGQRVPSLKLVHGLLLKADRFGMYLSIMPVFDPSYLARRGGLLSSEGQAWVDDIRSIRDYLEVGIG